MMARLARKPVLFLTLAFTALGLTARSLGSTLPPNPALIGFATGCDHQPRPCWYGIVPEVSSLPDVEMLLNASDYVQSYDTTILEARGQNCSRLWLYRGLYDSWAKPVSSVPIGLMFAGCHALTLGDFVSVLGAPQVVAPGVRSLYVIYPQPYLRLVVLPKNDHLWLRATTPVIEFHIGQPRYLPPAYTAYEWRDFASFTDYRLSQPDVGGLWYTGS
ncbi:MAG: hypothetical protein R3E39_20520 [Anaerolineae bacterium]